MIQIQDVSFEYEKEQGTLSHIDLNIQQGECVVLTGESGCGKTTVTKLINGLIPHFVEGGTLSGTTIVNGMEVPKTEMYRLAEQVGSVFQNPKSQFFNIDSDSEITFGLENAGVEPKKIKERYEATVSALKIQSLLGRNIFSMSGGEKQSLAFASVYAMNPSVFVLDEPTANLDADAIDTLRQQIIQIKKEGRTVVIAEHRLYFLMDLIDRAIFIQKGKIVQAFSRDEFRNLSDEQRIRMGLRSLVHPVLELPPADPPGAQEGLSVENLSCAFDKQPVFSGLGFSAKRGEVLGIVGHNGAGKTTMTRCLCGLLKEVNGTVRLDGQTLKAKQRNKASFCVMQDVNHQLFSDSKKAESAYKISRNEDDKRYYQYLMEHAAAAMNAVYEGKNPQPPKAKEEYLASIADKNDKKKGSTIDRIQSLAKSAQAALPAANEEDRQYLDYIIRGEDSVLAHWMKLGADGFRLDAELLKQRSEDSVLLLRQCDYDMCWRNLGMLLCRSLLGCLLYSALQLKRKLVVIHYKPPEFYIPVR